MKYDCVIFDLDGTLIDNSTGICSSIVNFLPKFGVLGVSEEEVRPMFKDCTRSILKNHFKFEGEKLENAMKIHRNYMKTQGLFKVKLYDGVTELLEFLKSNGVIIALATLKNEFIANEILKNLNISHFFSAIYGQDDAESLEKAGMIEKIKSMFNPKKAILIGDSWVDGEAAKKSGVDFGAVMYGMCFKNKSEAEAFSPVFSCENVFEIKDNLK